MIAVLANVVGPDRATVLEVNDIGRRTPPGGCQEEKVRR
jgi:hypothetical protein